MLLLLWLSKNARFLLKLWLPLKQCALPCTAAVITVLLILCVYFSASAQCNGTILTVSTSGTINSPDYPLDYQNDVACQWRIIGPSTTNSVC